ncbi:hypothetical protein OF83DRAFT_1101502 [Amylostereum chailletii]|nr:hypothetical protein OF83DRAFT_1101502 [Amylostereum chailletii]
MLVAAPQSLLPSSHGASDARLSHLDHERTLAIQLMHLASQFHASDYCRAKFGARGSALTYMPMSIHLPDHFKQLLARQALYMNTEPWLLCDRDAPEPVDIAKRNPSESSVVESAEHPVTLTRFTPDIDHELIDAIETPLGLSPLSPSALKTSDTHPLNVSTIVPSDLLPTLSLHLSLAPARSPTLFTVHSAFSLERVTSPPPPTSAASYFPPPGFNTPPPPVPPLSPHLYTAPPPPPTFPISDERTTPVLQIWNRSSMVHALQSALAITIRKGPSSSPSRHFSQNGLLPSPRLPPLKFGEVDLLGEILAQARAQGEGISKGRHERAYTAPPALFKALLAGQQSNSFPHTKSVQDTEWDGSLARPRRPTLVNRSKVDPPLSSASPPTLGNLLLSSCPGKKVRLNGPIRGRGSVRRDLKQDLQRIKGLGVGCIVCCLDDAELEFLGAPWAEYAQIARELKLDVLRIPMPEGLAPPCPQAFDHLLSQLIDNYTLAGIPVLTHCRGGVGRAGLVACCWMVKLGLCSWPSAPSTYPPVGTKGLGELTVRADTLSLVERVIGVVRRRRSLKAIETYEQVRFLVGYVEYLRAAALADA